MTTRLREQIAVSRWLATLALWCGAAVAAAAYDPLAVPAEPVGRTVELSVHDSGRTRDIPLLVYLPAAPPGSTAPVPAPVVLFSHGLGGARENNPYLGKHWSARGYVGVFLQHPGSDAAVWQGKVPARRMAALQAAATAQNLVARAEDVRAVLDALAQWNTTPGHPLLGRLDLLHIGMSGHSFGAGTTQAVSGQSYPLVGTRFTDARIRAATMFSPSAPRGGDVAAAFAGVRIPWLLMTGTKDAAPIGGQTVASRLAVFPALPAGSKYELVLYNAEHSAFSQRALPGDGQTRNPNHHRAIQALSTAFWDAYLRDDAAAKAWLDGDGPRTVLEANDRWQRK